MGMMDEVKTKKKLKAAETWFNMAETAKTQEKQVEYYTKSLDYNPYNAEAWFRKGRVLEKMGRFNDAQRSFDHAIEIDPDYQGLIGKTDTFEPTIDSESEQFSDSDEFEIIHPPAESEDEWVTEKAENQSIGFTPPVGEESIFSGLGRDEEDESFDDNTFVGPETREDGFSQEIPTQDEEEITFAAVSGVEREEESSEEVVSPISTKEEITGSIIGSEPETATVSDSFLTSDTSAGKAEKDMQMPGSDISRTGNPGISGSESGQMDIRIPPNEMIKFWLVGIVAIVIAFKLLEFI